jgi:pimeloyl-ACP methyl ester carboxylesterase
MLVVRRFAVLFAILLLEACATRPEPPGMMVPVNGHQMHIYCSGAESALPTIVLEGANMGLSPFYRNLQESVARQVRVCSYDRAGIAWSEPGAGPRDAKTIASELHVLLQEADVRPPFLLAGHSLGGLFALRYAHDYPDEVAALALLDSSHPDQNRLLPDATDDIANEMKILARLRWLLRLGASHIYNPYRAQLKPLPPAAFREALYFTHQPSMVDAIMGETAARPASMAEAGEVKSLGSMPLLVVSRGITYEPNPEASAEDNERRKRIAEGWIQLHREYLALSTQSRYLVVPGSNHYTLVSERAFADQVAAEIVKLAEAAR